MLEPSGVIMAKNIHYLFELKVVFESMVIQRKSYSTIMNLNASFFSLNILTCWIAYFNPSLLWIKIFHLYKYMA